MGFQHLAGMDQHGIACRMAQRIVDLLKAVEVDMQQGNASAAQIAMCRVAPQHFVEIAPVRQPRQTVMQGIELDAHARRFQLGIARFGDLLGVVQIFVAGHVLGNVPIGADDTADIVVLAVEHPHGPHMMDRAVWPDHPVLRFIAATADHACEFLFGALAIIGVDGRQPMLVAARRAVVRQAIDLIGAAVPVLLPGRHIEIPDADL